VNLVEDRFLAGVVIVDAGFLNAAQTGDFADAGGEIALAVKQVGGNTDNFVFHMGHGKPRKREYMPDTYLPDGRFRCPLFP
jgi:hypothetical protein